MSQDIKSINFTQRKTLGHFTEYFVIFIKVIRSLFSKLKIPGCLNNVKNTKQKTGTGFFLSM